MIADTSTSNKENLTAVEDDEEQPICLPCSKPVARDAAKTLARTQLVSTSMNDDQKNKLRMGSKHTDRIDIFTVRNASSSTDAFKAFERCFECSNKQPFFTTALAHDQIRLHCPCMTKTIKVKQKENEASTYEFLIGKKFVKPATRHITLKPAYRIMDNTEASRFIQPIPPSGIHVNDVVVRSRSPTLSLGYFEVETSDNVPFPEAEEEILVGSEPSFKCIICFSTFSSWIRARAISDCCSHVMCIPCAQRFLSNQTSPPDGRFHQVLKAGKCSICRQCGVWRHSITGQHLPNGHHIYGFHFARYQDSVPHDAAKVLTLAITNESLWNTIYQRIEYGQEINLETLEIYNDILGQLLTDRRRQIPGPGK